jgi:hypothetical protein
MTWRRLRPGELDHEALWLGVSVAAAALTWLWLALDLPRPACVFHALTGCPCPGCGTTRSMAYAFSGQFGAAFRMNPLCGALLCGAAIFDVYAAVVLVARLPRLRPDGAALSPWLRAIAVAALALNWAWLIRSGV